MSTPETEVPKLDESKPEPASLAKQEPGTVAGFGTAGGFELLQRQASMMSKSGLVPPAYKGNIANCAIAIELASRLGMSPIMVAQNLDVISDRPAWRSQFIIATVNDSKRFSTLRFDFAGEGDKRACVAWAIDRESGQRVEGPAISIQMAKNEGWYGRKGSKWQTLPDLMLRYRAAAFFGRLYTPDRLVGLMSADEVEDITPRGPTKAELAARLDGPVAAQDAPESTIEAEVVPDTEPTRYAESVADCPHDGGSFTLKGVESCVKCGGPLEAL